MLRVQSILLFDVYLSSYVGMSVKGRVGKPA
jgi:hypothetical protein